MIFLLSVILVLAIVPLTLRGGTLHSYLVAEAEAVCRQEGYDTAREHPLRLPDGRTDYVDLAVRKDGRLVCVEVETSPRNVMTNVHKARCLGVPLIVVVPTNQTRQAVRGTLRRHCLGRNRRAVCVLLLGQLRQVLRKCLPLNSPASARAKTRKSNTPNHPSGPAPSGSCEGV